MAHRILTAPAWAAVLRWIRSAFPDVHHISVRDLASRMKAETDRPHILLDTRHADEYAVSRIPGAIWLDPDTSDDELAHLLPKDTRIIAYCSIGYRSAATARRLASVGYTDISNLEGSLFRWAADGHPIVDDKGSSREVHPYDRLWGLLLPRSLRSPLNR